MLLLVGKTYEENLLFQLIFEFVTYFMYFHMGNLQPSKIPFLED